VRFRHPCKSAMCLSLRQSFRLDPVSPQGRRDSDSCELMRLQPRTCTCWKLIKQLFDAGVEVLDLSDQASHQQVVVGWGDHSSKGVAVLSAPWSALLVRIGPLMPKTYCVCRKLSTFWCQHLPLVLRRQLQYRVCSALGDTSRCGRPGYAPCTWRLGMD